MAESIESLYSVECESNSDRDILHIDPIGEMVFSGI